MTPPRRTRSARGQPPPAEQEALPGLPDIPNVVSAGSPAPRQVSRAGASDAAQLSFFGAEGATPTPLDLEGLLVSAGQVIRMGGTARVSIVVEASWRAAVLLTECADRGIAASWEPATVQGHLGVRTAYAAALAPLGTRWLRGAVKAPPPGLILDGRRLRLWLAAAGGPDGVDSFALRLGAGDGEAVWQAAGAALAVVGLPAVLLGPRAGGPALRIAGRRRLARLRELVGDPPRRAAPDAWPA